MKRISTITLTLVAAAFFAACGAPAGNAPAANNANTNSNANAAAKPVAAAPTKVALMALEGSSYNAWKNKDTKFWDTFFADNFVSFGATGLVDRATAIKAYSSNDCILKTFAFSDDEMTP